jgi:hypothetical protein
MAVFRERTPLPPMASTADSPPPNFPRYAPLGAPMLPAPAPAPIMAAPPPPAAALSPAPAAPAQRSMVETLNRPSMALNDEKLGTAHGASEWSVVNTVDFVRATKTPQTVSSIEYDTWDHLVAAGVIPTDTHRHPQAFPGEPRLSYVPDPPN